MRRKIILLVLLSSAGALQSCATAPVLVSPIAQVLFMLTLEVGKETLKSAALATLEACMDEIVRPLLRRAVGNEPKKSLSGTVEYDPANPLRGVLRGKFEFVRTRPAPPKKLPMFAIELVRDSLTAEWIYDPAYMRLMKQNLGAERLMIRQVQ